VRHVIPKRANRVIVAVATASMLASASWGGEVDPRQSVDCFVGPAGLLAMTPRGRAGSRRKRPTRKRRLSSTAERRRSGDSRTPSRPVDPPVESPTAVSSAPATAPGTSLDNILDPSLAPSTGSGRRSPWATSGDGPMAPESQPSFGASMANPSGTIASPTVAHGAIATEGVSSATNQSNSGPWIEGALSLHMFYRQQRYNQDLFQALRPYRVIAPALGGSVALYPGAAFGTGVLSNIGVAAAYERAIGLTSGVAGADVKFPTSSDAFLVGPQYRFAFDPFRFAVRAGYAWRAFTISNSPSELKPDIPSVDYRNVFAQAFVTWEPGTLFAVDLEAGYHYLLSLGELGSASYFPHATGAGVDASLGLTLLLHPAEVQLAVDVEHYFFSMNPRLGDPYIAGGALDDYLGVRLTVQFGLH
jgi:hypothetical protein